jgi:tripartite-type tricarboxylate transporter receptor subunit TctC
MATLSRIAAIAIVLVASADVQAQTPQSRPVRIVNPFAAGGNTDLVTRALIERLTPLTKQQYLVENRPGAMTNIASEYVVKAAPDGTTLLMGGASNAINMSLFAKPTYDTLRDFEPVILCFKGGNLLAVHPVVPARTLKELIALAKARPGALNYASSGAGSSNHMAGELLKVMAGIDLQHIPYKGNAPALTDTIGGHVHMLFAGVPSLLPHLQSGRLRAIAISTSRRFAAVPDVPTFDEAGVKGYEATNWFGLLAPARTPNEVVASLNGALQTVITTGDIRERFAKEGLETVGGSAAAFRAFLREEVAKYARVVKIAGLAKM